MFTREDTKAVKGMAVIMMLLHHLGAFTDRYALDFQGFQSFWKPFAEDGYLGILSANVRLCVALFYFTGGYGLYKRWNTGKFSLPKSIAGLYQSYWKVFLIFVPIAFIFFRKEPDTLPNLYTRYWIADGKSFMISILSNFLGLSDSLNSEWWFFASYLCVLPMGLLFCMATKKTKSFTLDIFLVFVIDMLVRDVFAGLPRIEALSGLGSNFYYTHFLRMSGTSPFFAGIIFAKHDKLEACKAYLHRFRFSGLLGLIGCLGVLFVRSFILGELIEIIHATAFVIFLSLFFDSIKPVKKIFGFIGKYSTDMWLVHTFFCYYFRETAKIVYSTRSLWIDLLILTAFSLGSSVLLELFWKGISLLMPKLKKYLLRPETQQSAQHS